MGTLAARQRLGARSYAGEHPARSRPSASLGAASVPPAACSPVIALGGAKGELNAPQVGGVWLLSCGQPSLGESYPLQAARHQSRWDLFPFDPINDGPAQTLVVLHGVVRIEIQATIASLARLILYRSNQHSSNALATMLRRNVKPCKPGRYLMAWLKFRLHEQARAS
jgi:hypothetical protein